MSAPTKDSKQDLDPLKLTYTLYIKLPQTFLFKTSLIIVIIFQTVVNIPYIVEILMTFNGSLLVLFGPMFFVNFPVILLVTQNYN